MAKVWRFLSVSIVVAVCLGLLLVPAMSPSAVSGGGVTCGIELHPSKATVGFGENFTVDMWVDNPAHEEINGYAANVSFTAGLINVTGITMNTGVFDVAMPPTWDNTTGSLVVCASMILAPNTTASSIHTCTIDMRSNSNDIGGIAAINFTLALGRTAVYEYGTAANLLNPALVVNGTVRVGEPTPRVSVSPTSLTFTTVEGENPADKTLEVCNSGTGTLNWSLIDNAAWLSGTPTSGSLGEDECEDVTVSVDVTGMEAGDYSATITFTGAPEVEVAVNLHIESTAPVEPVEPVEPANLSVSSVSISPQQVKPNQQVTISINVANTGGETGSYNAILYINSVVEDSQSVSVAPGMTKNVIFTVSKSQAGVYDVSLAGQNGQFEVVSTGWFGGGLGTGGIVAIVVVVIALIVALVFMLRRTRRAV